MKQIFMGLLSIFIIQTVSNAEVRDFGQDGLNGLTEEQKKSLFNGDSIFSSSESEKRDSKSALIEASIIFNNTPERTWELISKTEDQYKYLKECKEVKVVSKSNDKSVEVHTVGALLFKISYGVIHNFDSKNMYINWTLDPNHKDNGLQSLQGYWRLYPYGNGKTLARYGSNVGLKNVPEFLEKLFKKTGVKNALVSVKKYIDSNGTYHK